MDNNQANQTDVRFSKTTEDFLAEDFSQYPDTFPMLLEFLVGKYGDNPCVSKALTPPITYREFHNKVVQVSTLLVKRGVLKGDRVALLGENSPHWGITYYAILRSGAIAVPILPDFPETDIRHILNDCEAKILFTTNKQLEKLGDLPQGLKTIIMLDDFAGTKISGKMEVLVNVFDKALDFFKKLPGTMGIVSKEIKSEDTASIIYTSGTSGHSKAVMLSHRNLISNAVACMPLMDFSQKDIFLSILPMSHAYEFTVGFMLPLLHGARIIYLEKPPTPRILEQVCKKEKPTAICSVPLIMEKIFKKKVLPVIENNTAVKWISKIPGVRVKIYKKISRKLLDFFGGRLRIMAIGGAPFNSEAEHFFKKAEFPYLIGYGLTETAPLLAGGPMGTKTLKVSGIGQPTPGCELKIVAPDEETGIGEIIARGPNVMKGYYKNPELTAEVIDKDGWFSTGDLGYIDKDNILFIKGRSKNMILLANGENIYPEAIEGKLNACFYVLESLVLINNDQLEAWVYLDYDLIDAATRGKNERRRLEFIDKVLDETRADVNAQLSPHSRLSRVFEQEEAFVKTATHKIKRYLYTHNRDKKK